MCIMFYEYEGISPTRMGEKSVREPTTHTQALRDFVWRLFPVVSFSLIGYCVVGVALLSVACGFVPLS